MIKDIHIRILFFFFISLLSACNYNGGRDRVSPPAAKAPLSPANEDQLKDLNADQVDFELIKQNILEPRCFSCHSKDKNKGDVNLETYQNVLANIKAIEKDIMDGSMPPKSKPELQLSKTLKDLILKWIKAGAPETKSSPAATVVDHSHLTATEKEILSRGEYLFNLSSCDICHTVDKSKPLAGGKALTMNFGTFYTTNISKDKKTGIGNWSEKDFLRAMRKGLSPQGKYYYPTFPYTNYSKLSDEDILAIRSYILSLPGTEQANKPHEVKFPFNIRAGLFAWQKIFFPKHQTDNNYLLSQGPFKPIESQDFEWNRGAYLVEGPLHCTVCHTPRYAIDDFKKLGIPVEIEIGGLIKSKWMSGSKDSGEKFPAPNITPDSETGLNNWSATDWLNFLNLGTTPSGGKVSGEMRKIVRYGTSTMTDADKSAVIKYLMSLKPVQNKEIFNLVKYRPSSENDEKPSAK